METRRPRRNHSKMMTYPDPDMEREIASIREGG